jgi:hypothetical protein
MIRAGTPFVIHREYRVERMRGERYVVTRICDETGSAWARPDQFFERKTRVHRACRYETVIVLEPPRWEILFGMDEVVRSIDDAVLSKAA